MPFEVRGVEDLAALHGIGSPPVFSDEPPDYSEQPVTPTIGFRSVADIPLMRDCGESKVNYLEHPLVIEGCLTALSGGPGCGKSTIATAILRRQHDAGRPCGILDRENSKPGIEDRFNRLRMSDDASFHVWGDWVRDETGQQVRAPNPGSAPVQIWVAQCEPKPCILVDGLSAFFGGDNQNDAAQMRKFLDPMRRLCAMGATVILVHHDGKSESSKDYRGSSDFAPAIDIGFHVTTSNATGYLDRLLLRCYKHRFGFAGEITYDYADGRLLQRIEPEAASETVTEQFTVLLRLNPGISARGFDQKAADRGLGRNRARQWLNDGVSSGAIRYEPGAHNGRRYFLAGESHDVE